MSAIESKEAASAKPERSMLVRRLREPPFGTETSERNLMAAAADRIEALEAENEILEAQRGHMLQNWESAADSVEALEAALRRFGQHSGTCHWHGGFDCNCGLDRAISHG